MKEYNKTVIDCVLGQRLSNGYVAQTLWQQIPSQDKQNNCCPQVQSTVQFVLNKREYTPSILLGGVLWCEVL